MSKKSCLFPYREYTMNLDKLLGLNVYKGTKIQLVICDSCNCILEYSLWTRLLGQTVDDINAC